jgi:Tfp pilus assembly protein PilO
MSRGPLGSFPHFTLEEMRLEELRTQVAELKKLKDQVDRLEYIVAIMYRKFCENYEIKVVL